MSYFFNGVNSALRPPANVDFGSRSNFTACAWVYVLPGGGSNIMNVWNAFDTNSFLILPSGVNGTATATFGDPFGIRQVTSASTMYAGIWYHIASTYLSVDLVGETFKYFINGVEDASATNGSYANLRAQGATQLGIGCPSSPGDQGYFTGYICHAQLYSTNLSAANFQLVMKNPQYFYGNLLAWWPMIEDSQVAVDLSPNANHAVKVGNVGFSLFNPTETTYISPLQYPRRSYNVAAAVATTSAPKMALMGVG